MLEATAVVVGEGCEVVELEGALFVDEPEVDVECKLIFNPSSSNPNNTEHKHNIQIILCGK